MKTYKTTISNLKLVREKSNFIKSKICSSKDSSVCIRQFFSDNISIYESFFCLMLDRSNNTIAYVKISQGGTISTIVDIKLIAKYCIDSLASAIIICHNHPSGNTNPSKADKEITQKIKETLKLFDTILLDHIILTEDSYLSLADEGLL